MLLTSKFNNDVYYSNEQVAGAGGISLIEINVLERFFCETVDFNLYISEEDFDRYLMGMQHHQ